MIGRTERLCWLVDCELQPVAGQLSCANPCGSCQHADKQLPTGLMGTEVQVMLFLWALEWCWIAAGRPGFSLGEALWQVNTRVGTSGAAPSHAKLHRERVAV